MRLLVVVVQQLPIRFLGCYGSPDVDTPTLDQLASVGVVFDWHFATALGADALELAGIRVALADVPNLLGENFLVRADAVLEIDPADDDPADDPDDRAALAEESALAAAVQRFDAELGAAIDRLQPEAIVVTALQGDDGEREPALHLPLVVSRPGHVLVGHRVSQLTQAVDLQPLLRGESWELAAGAGQGGRPLIRFALPSGDVGLRTHNWAVYSTPSGRPQLYRKPGDANDVHDLAALHLDWAEHAVEVARGTVSELLPEPSVD